MSRIFLFLCGIFVIGLSYAEENAISSCLKSYVYFSRGSLYLRPEVVLGNKDPRSDLNVFPLKEICQRVGLERAQLQIVSDQQIVFFKLVGGVGEVAILQTFKPNIQLAVYAQVSKSFEESASHPIELSVFPNLIFTYQIRSEKKGYIESISYGQKWESEGD